MINKSRFSEDQVLNKRGYAFHICKKRQRERERRPAKISATGIDRWAPKLES
jgi:hypothetical protein